MLTLKKKVLLTLDISAFAAARSAQSKLTFDSFYFPIYVSRQIKSYANSTKI